MIRIYGRIIQQRLRMKEKIMVQRTAGSGMRAFFIMWVGQTISLTGSGLTGFALGIWVFQTTGSATALTLIAFFGILPIIVFSPLAGALVDRWDRRWTLILSDAGAALTPLLILVMFRLGRTEIWPIYIIVAVSGLFRALQFPAFGAATTLLVPKEQYGRAAGLTQLAGGIGQIISPVLAGILIGLIGITGIFLIDVLTFLFSIGTLLIISIPRPEVSAAGRVARGTLLHEVAFGWHYIVARPGLLGLLLFFASSNFLMGTVIALSTPLLLSFTTTAVLGTVLSVAGFGILGTSVLMSIWGGPKRRVYGVLGGALMSGVCILLAGLAPSALLIGTTAFFFAAGLPIVTTSSQAIWQRKVEPDIQGRVFAIRGTIATASLPVAYLVSGPLADYVFNPLLTPNGPLANSVGRIIGTGPGRGIGLLFIVLGILNILAVIIGYMYPRLRFVEDELPDAVPDSLPATATDAPAQDFAGASATN
jgi:DHA3 family macrolide efflux protein-like MFS transporter